MVLNLDDQVGAFAPCTYVHRANLRAVRMLDGVVDRFAECNLKEIRVVRFDA
jgi:hypothetical protein